MKLLNIFCIVAVATIAVSDARKVGLSESFEIVGGLAKAANRIVAKAGEKYINRSPSRSLQSGTPFGEVTDQCINLLFPNAANDDLSTTPASIEAFLKCVKGAVTSVFSTCLSNFPGIEAPSTCLIDLGFSDELIVELSNAGSEYDAGSSSEEDSTQDFETAFETEGSFPESNCSIFGSAADPKAAACFSLIDTNDIPSFVAAFSNNFAGYQADCSTFLQLLQDSNATSAPGTGDSDQATVESDIAQYEENFGSCAESDGIRTSLESTYTDNNNGAAGLSLWAVFAVPSLLLCLLSA